ncbi:ComEC/Rec2 family competence protein [Kocuria tytonicola]|uniref:ComEC/Rec2 family competence protein n=1 Tax=Kocuria tytonicola TaxID=2055946 RepID=A0A3L9L822_9MICC|nr:ComEC/Rec2 family competence protein [Kocuria tytonicola]RLY94980.1 ComEC/Rec2 family competence protein [Kocuria tytonicola]
MTVTWDLRLLPVALAVWITAAVTLAGQWQAGAVCALLCTAGHLLVCLAPHGWRWLRARRSSRTPASGKGMPGAGRRTRARPSQRGTWTVRRSGPGTVPRPHARNAMVTGHHGTAVLTLVVLLAGAAALVSTLTATAPARAFLVQHPQGSVVRLEATVSGTPSPYTSHAGAGEQEAAHGVAVTLDVQRADGAPTTGELTVFATHPGWDGVRDGERVGAVVTVADTAAPARLLARATSPPVSAGHGGQDPGLLEAVRADLTRVAGGFGAVSAGLVPGMTVGDTSQLPAALAQSMKDTGLTHLTAVSGSNCALVMTLTGFAALTLGAGRRMCVTVGLAALAGFVLLVGPDPSVLRAGVMGALGGVAMLSGRPGVSLNALCAAVTGLVLTRPDLAADMGFVLSVLATAGIVVSARPVTRVLGTRLPTVLAVCIAVPLVAQLWCGPALLLLNPDLPLYSLPANMAAAPLVPVVTVAGLLAVCVLLAGHLLDPALALLVPGPADPAAVTAWDRGASLPVGVASYPARALGWIADTFAALPGAHVPWPPGLPGVLLLTVLTILALAALHTVDARMRRPPPVAGTVDPAPAAAPVPDAVRRVRAHRLRGRRRLLAVTASLTLVMLLVTALVWWLRPAPAWESVVCDVGQGDAVLHRTGEHRAVLVDGGPDPRALTRCLRQADVTHLDAVIATHDHADHVAGFDGLAETVDVDRVWYSAAGDTPPDELQQWTGIATRPAPGEQLHLGPLTVEVLAPVPPTPVESSAPGSAGGARPPRSTHRKVTSEDENNASLVLLLTMDGPDGPTTWLSAGDLETDGYRRELPTFSSGRTPHVDVLKVSHHGARNGGTDIVHDTHPALAVISVGKDNSYGHPHPQTLAALHEVGAAVARTDQNGALWIRREGGRVVAARG